MCASRVRRVKQLSLNYLTPPRCVDGGLQRSGRSPRLGAVAVYRPADPGRDVRTFLRGGCRQDACLPVRRPRDSGLRDLHPFVGGGARWVAENLHATLSSAASHRKKGWSPRADSNRRPSPYQECALRESATPEGLVASAASSPTRPGNRQVALQLCWCVYHQGFKARGSNPGRASTSVSVGGILVWLAISCLRSASICST